MTIFTRLTIGYVTIMVMVLFMGFYSTVKRNQINGIYIKIHQIEEPTIEMAERIYSALLSQISFGKKFLAAGDKDFLKQFKELQVQIRADIKKLSGLIKTEKKRKSFNAIEKLYDQLAARIDRTNENLVKDEVFVQEMEQSWDRLSDEINVQLRNLVSSTRSDMDHQLNQLGQISAQILNVNGITAALIILTGIVISLFNTRSINGPIRTLQLKTKEIAKGKFEEISSIVSPPEIKALADHFNHMCRRLKELEEMKIDFITHISHELRTPLTSIKEASSMLLEKVYEKNSEKQNELLLITQEECERLIISVNRILDLGRMEAGMMNFNFKACQVKALIQKSVMKIRPIVLRKEARVALQIQPDLPPVYIDEARIEEVFENILGNALKVISRNDSVTIHAEITKDQENFVQVSVSDTGPGIPAADLEHIFDKFHRIENDIETARGTGLGLSIVKHIISSHGGRIWVNSKEGIGSTFYFTLPVFTSQHN